jgi:hypothetical protein
MLIFFSILAVLFGVLLVSALFSGVGDGDEAFIIFLVGLFFIWIGVWAIPVHGMEYPSDKENEYIQISNVNRNNEYVSYNLVDEAKELEIIVHKEAKYVNNNFKAYRKFHKNGYGNDMYNVEYEFGPLQTTESK